MVLMRRRDKRRGNADEEIIVASDSSIVANKGVRSLQSARSGRFAADMRANVGGYGRPDKTWGVDHPWHTTEQSDLYSALCSRDRMEDGTLLREEQAEREAARGASRAALKKRKAKLKKQGLSAQEAAEIAAKEAEEAKRKHEEEQRLAAEQEAERKRKKSAKAKAVTEQLETEETAAGDDEPIEDKPKEVADTPDEAHEAQDRALSKKQQKKEKKKQKKKAAVEAAKTEEVADLNEQKISAAEELKAREMLAKQYEAAFGSEITTESGLVILDQRLGNGKLADLGEMLTVRYRGRLGKEGMVFGKGMLTTKFGTGSVIAGWEEGLGTMRTGGVRRLTIPPELGYGASGKGGKIPPNSTLYFEVELIRFGKRKRDAVGEDEVPLPSSFQRKRIKQKPGKQDGDDEDGEHSGKKRKKNNRRKHKRPISE